MTPQNKTAIVTGAGSGIGRATSIQLAQLGYHIVMVGRTRQKLQETARHINADATVHVADVCDPAQCQDIIAQTDAQRGQIDALVNVAGSAPSLPIAQITPEIWRQTIDTNLSAIVHLTAASWRLFTRQQQGIIVNISSLASVDPFEGFGIYAAAKAGVNMFTKVTAQEGASINLRAVAIAPGAVETPMLRALFDESAIPTEKTLSPQQVSAVICDCIEKQRDFAPGETILLPSP